MALIKNGVNIELEKTSRLKALRMMENHTQNKQTMCQQTKTKHESKNQYQKKKERSTIQQTALDKAANNIK